MYRAALSELRTEVQLFRRNDTQTLRAEAYMITREVDALQQKLNEDVALMKNDVALDMNNRKNETRELQQEIDMRIQEINNRLTVVLGDMRTEIEAIRWETIWKTLGKHSRDETHRWASRFFPFYFMFLITHLFFFFCCLAR